MVLFDLDGTLTDSKVGIIASLRHGLMAVGVTPPDDEVLTTLIGPSLFDTLGPRFDLSPTAVNRAVAAYRDYFVERGMYENELYPGVAELLGDLARGGVRLALATAKPLPFARQILAHFAIAAHFSAVAGATLDGSVRDKTSIIAAALADLATGPRGPAGRFTMVGDRGEDIAGCRANAGRAIGAAWGYGHRDELVAAGADLVVSDVAALRAALGLRPVAAS